MPIDSSLDLFHPLIADWFRREIGRPTEIQRLAWPRIADGAHVLISAPTGSGKTLTAFLWALDRLFRGEWEGDRVRVLYISPLRALNADVRRNLEGPLEALRARFAAADESAPRIRVATRSGDTEPAARRKMLRHPPEILVTTPESLNILLTSKSGRSLLGDLRAVVLDEIHAVAGSKRGVHLLTALERLVPLSGEFQRIALSATVRPMETVAEMVGGRALLGDAPTARDDEAVYAERPVEILRSTVEKRYDVRVRFPVDAQAAGGMALGTDATQADDRATRESAAENLWETLVADFRTVIRRNQSTLLFCNSRRTTEKVTRMINSEGETLAYSHHGSLSREVRREVEQRLKDGELRAIVATNSLELGIDIGALDQVVLVQTPPSVASAVQRVGRAGHGVGEVSRGVLYPTHGLDLLESAVVARAITEQEIESIRPVEAPLDVLAQVILSMVVAESLGIEELFARVRCSWPYRELSRGLFDRVLDMLAGRYADSRIRELRPRLTVDRVRGTLTARKGSDRVLYMAGGTIADRGYFALRHQDTGAKIGDLDEEFVWERSIGDTFALGAQHWQIQRITHNDVLVRPGRGTVGAALAPFWRAEKRDRGYFVSQKTLELLEDLGTRLRDPALPIALRESHRLEEEAARELIRFLESQRAATGGKLPRRDRLLVEVCRGGRVAPGMRQVILHSFWGGSVHRPLALALASAWEERHGETLDVFHDDGCLLAVVPEDLDVRDLLALAPPEQIEELLRRQLEDTGYFGARFRVAAQAALLLPRAGFGKRTPLWLHRQRSKALLEAVSNYGDFPVVVEAWRTCLRDEFDLIHLKAQLARVSEGAVELEEVVTESPSPLAAGVMWQATSHFLYKDDAPDKAGGSRLRRDVLEELVHAAHLRPKIPVHLVERFRRKAQRTEVGYAPPPGDELRLWIEERLLLGLDAWRELVAAIARDHDTSAEEVIASVADVAVRVTLPSGRKRSTGGGEGITALDVVPRLARALGLEPEALDPVRLDGAPLPADAVERIQALAWIDLDAVDSRQKESKGEALVERLAEWLRHHGPVPVAHLSALWGRSPARLAPTLEALTTDGLAVVGELTDGPIPGGDGEQIVDARNLEILLRWLRVESRPQVETLDARFLPLFLARHQGLAGATETLEGPRALEERLEQLFGWPARAGVWETELLPARLDPYYPAWLDAALQQSELTWVGTGDQRLTFAFRSDLDLLFEGSESDEPDPDPQDDTGEVDEVDEAPGEASGDGVEDRDGEAIDEPENGSVATLVAAANLDTLLPEGGEPAALEALARRAQLPVRVASELLWHGAWRGEATADSFAPVRRGLATRFAPPKAARAPKARRGRRSGRGWSTSPEAGSPWRRLPPASGRLEGIDREELVKDRVRLLLDRWGVVFRELLVRELPALRWARVFRTLRIMELSGEVLAGYFFHGVRGLQFIAHGAYRELLRGLPEDAVWWCSAVDPVSACGLGIEGLQADLPSRLPSTHLVYHGAELVLVSRRRGRQVELRVPPTHPRLLDYARVFEHLLGRGVAPLSSVTIETIDGEPAAGHELVRRLESVVRVTREGGSVRLWKVY